MIADKFAHSVLDTDAERVAATRALAEAMHELFAGRADAYSTKKVNKDGRKAYYPVCSNKFGEGCRIGEQSRPCDDCNARKLTPLTVDTFVQHLRGEVVVGLYLLKEGNVHLAAVDFDDHGNESAEESAVKEAPLIMGPKMVEAAREMGITAFLERSGGGKGCHVWVFFEEWVKTRVANRLMELLLRRAGLPKKTEIFPRQRDARTFGNLIGLPYQAGPDKWATGSAFLDPDSLEPLDPMAVMADIKENLVSEFLIAKICKELKALKTDADDDLPAPRASTGEGDEPEAAVLVENPIAAIFASCAALKRVRDDPQDESNRHGMGHKERLALAGVIRDLPGGHEEIHRIVAARCVDYNAAETDKGINSLHCPPMLCETLQADGVCQEPCSAIRERNNKSPVAFAYKRTRTEDGKAEIKVTVDEAAMFDAALVALRSHPNVYQRGGLLVAIITDELPNRSIVKRDDGTPRIDYIPKAWIQHDLAEVARFIQFKSKGWKPVEPPHNLVEEFYKPRRLTGIRVLSGVTESPLLRPDGSIITRPGYDPRTGLYYKPFDTIPDIPDQPTQADALQARDELHEVVQDFPFEDPQGFSAWLALLFTYFARPTINGAMPLFVIDANVRSAGKSLLAQLAAIIMTGRKAATIGWSKDEIENKKSLTSLFIAGDPVILFDNVDCQLGGAALNAALTSTDWDDRILGESRRTGKLPINSLLMATSNNATFGADTVRRTIHISLHSPYEHPEDRTDVSIEKIREWTCNNRPRLVRAVMTILRAFAVAKPTIKLSPMADYIEWSERVRAPLVWMGMSDPLMTQKVLAKRADSDASELGALMNAMLYAAPNGEWCTAATLVKRAESGTPGALGNGTWDGVPLRDMLLEYRPGRSKEGLPTAAVLAGRLTHYRNRVLQGMAIVCQRNTYTNTSEWRVQRTVSALEQTKDEAV